MLIEWFRSIIGLSMREEELYQEFLEGRALHLLPALFVGDLVIHRFCLEVGFLHSENCIMVFFLLVFCYENGTGLGPTRPPLQRQMNGPSPLRRTQ